MSHPSVVNISAIEAAICQSKQWITDAIDDFNLKVYARMPAGDQTRICWRNKTELVLRMTADFCYAR